MMDRMARLVGLGGSNTPEKATPAPKAKPAPHEDGEGEAGREEADEADRECGRDPAEHEERAVDRAADRVHAGPRVRSKHDQRRGAGRTDRQPSRTASAPGAERTIRK